MARTLAQLAREALQVQNACNMSGLVSRWGQAIMELREHLPDASTQRFNTHPINVLWASKVHDLAQLGLSDIALYGSAYESCQMMAAADTGEFQLEKEKQMRDDINFFEGMER